MFSRLNVIMKREVYVVDVTVFDETFLLKSLQKRMEENQMASLTDYIDFLDGDSSEPVALFNSLLIGYSEFFRNPLTFAVLEKIILPSLLAQKATRGRKLIRIWSAACSSGQEVYSLAILLEELAAMSAESFDYRIFATDCSEVQLKEARAGQYTLKATGNVNGHRLQKWFQQQGDYCLVNQKLREHIDFSLFDLLLNPHSVPPASIFGDFDLVFCSNLLFYYKKEYQNKILDKAGSSLAAGGYLVVGETERDIVFNHQYREMYPQSGIFKK